MIKSFIKNNYVFDLKSIILILLLIFVLGGIFGFIYETIFYRFDLGYFVKRGTTIGPWIPIYAFGSLFLVFLCYKFRSNPVIVFLLSGLICGLLEYFTGLYLFEVRHMRLWDYNTEILNFGNIGGYICLRSVLFFAVSGLFLTYIVLPIVLKIKDTCSVMFPYISIIPACIFITDIIYSWIFKK